MGLFDIFRKNTSGKFVSEDAYISNKIKQEQMTPEVLGQLRNMGVSDEKELKLEFFFYTNTIEKANELSDSLIKLDYDVQFGQSGSNKKLFVITGWSTKMPMRQTVVGTWAGEMCNLGYRFDCEFDGWGTTPDQN